MANDANEDIEAHAFRVLLMVIEEIRAAIKGNDSATLTRLEATLSPGARARLDAQALDAIERLKT